jgi:hypothetical protein
MTAGLETYWFGPEEGEASTGGRGYAVCTAGVGCHLTVTRGDKCPAQRGDRVPT